MGKQSPLDRAHTCCTRHPTYREDEGALAGHRTGAATARPVCAPVAAAAARSVARQP